MSTINDAGHGGTDPGAVANGVQEKVWALEASEYVNKRLNELGIKSTQTRSTDEGMTNTERTNRVKNSGAMICLSHHFNAGGGEGVETIHSIHSNPELATKIAHAIRDAGQRFRRVFSRQGSNGDYYFMHRMTGSVQTIIIEYGFLDNLSDVNKLKSKEYREKLYEAVVKVMCEHYKVAYKPIQATEKQSATNTLYRVQVGAFGVKENAEKLAKELKTKGYNTYIVQD